MTSYKYDDNLQSERLYTQKLTLDHIPVWAEFFESEETTEFLRAHVLETPEKSAEQWIRRQMDRYENSEYGLQALYTREGDRFIGLCGLILQEVDGKKLLEVGYHVLRKYWGMGYAPEAARTFMNYAFVELGKETIVSIIHVDNIKSQKVADKNGLKRDFKTNYKDMDVWIYRMNRIQSSVI
jgi:ribosomal-protein-alanine N-acetyltransferase